MSDGTNDKLYLAPFGYKIIFSVPSKDLTVVCPFPNQTLLFVASPVWSHHEAVSLAIPGKLWQRTRCLNSNGAIWRKNRNWFKWIKWKLMWTGFFLCWYKVGFISKCFCRCEMGESFKKDDEKVALAIWGHFICEFAYSHLVKNAWWFSS